MTLALGTVVLDGVACYIAARPSAAAGCRAGMDGLVPGRPGRRGSRAGLLQGSRRTRLAGPGRVDRILVILLGGLRFWFLAATGTGPVPAIAGACLFTVATAGLLALGYRALRVAETPPAWRARRQAGKARQAARIARAEADQNAAERDRLIDAYLGHVTRLALQDLPGRAAAGRGISCPATPAGGTSPGRDRGPVPVAGATATAADRSCNEQLDHPADPGTLAPACSRPARTGQGASADPGRKVASKPTAPGSRMPAPQEK